MDSIRQIFETSEMRGVIDAALKPVRKYEKKDTTNPNFHIPEYARFKMKAYFLDGNRKPFYSYDNVSRPDGTFIKDEREGLKKLIRLAENYRKQGVIKSVCIWATENPTAKTLESRYDFTVYKCTRYSRFETDAIGFGTDGRMRVLKNKLQM